MADSGHFDGGAFRGIDDDATRNNAPLTAALEGRLTNNSAWLHARGGGAPVRVYPGNSAGTLTSRSHVPHSTRTWHLIHTQPFLVTRGLDDVRLLVQASIEDFDCELVAELDGVKGALVRVTNTASAEQQFVELVTPAPRSQAERLVPLSIWCRALRGELPDPHPSHGDVITSNGVGIDFGSPQFTANTDRMVFLFVDEGVTFDPDAPTGFIEADPIYRALDFPKSGDAKLWQADEVDAYGSLDYFELPISYITIRSVQVEGRYS